MKNTIQSKALLICFLFILNFINCSNSSFHPIAISGDDTFNRVNLAFSEINAINPVSYALAAGALLTTLPEASLDSIALKGLLVASVSAETWTKNVVNRNKWYKEKDVDNCVSAIRKTGLLMNGATTVSSLQSLVTFSLIPQIAAKACNLKPLPDLIILRTGTEGKAEGDKEEK
ncbi:MAG: TIGR04452 family lipoprotein [Leptospiraceae bacterium]|nr:TIGR04452 family lipoprotein [Leptospiraceae bacterium]